MHRITGAVQANRAVPANRGRGRTGQQGPYRPTGAVLANISDEKKTAGVKMATNRFTCYIHISNAFDVSFLYWITILCKMQRTIYVQIQQYWELMIVIKWSMIDPREFKGRGSWMAWSHHHAAAGCFWELLITVEKLASNALVDN